MASIVVDASAIVEVLLHLDAAYEVTARLRTPGVQLHAPHLIDLEVLQSVRRRWRLGEIDDARAAQALAEFREIRINRHAHVMLLDRVWSLRHNLTAYDASYIALAELLGAPLVTRDGRLARSAGHAASIDLIA